MSNRLLAAASAAVLLVAGAALLYGDGAGSESARDADEPTGPSPTTDQITAAEAVGTDAPPSAPVLPPEFYAPLAPGETVDLTIPPGLTEGIRCPDGSYLPYLNGVDRAGPLQRNRHAGPLPPVVAKTMEADGLEWYVHADGSKTTTHRATIEVEGRPMENVLTRHVSGLEPGLELPVEPATPSATDH